MQNAIKHLPSKENSEDNEDNVDEGDNEENESSLLKAFSACMFEYEDRETFEDAFNVMRRNVKNQMDGYYL